METTIKPSLREQVRSSLLDYIALRQEWEMNLREAKTAEAVDALASSITALSDSLANLLLLISNIKD